jgi:hypothetical protein
VRIILLLLCLALVAGLGFLIYLSWAFSPKGSSPKPTTFRKYRKVAAAGDHFFAISELHDNNEPDTVIHEVVWSRTLEAARDNNGDVAFHAVNQPVPVDVVSLKPDALEIVLADGRRLPVALDRDGNVPFSQAQFFENGIAQRQ